MHTIPVKHISRLKLSSIRIDWWQFNSKNEIHLSDQHFHLYNRWILKHSYLQYYHITCSKYTYTLATTILIRHLSYYISCLHFQNKNLNFSKLFFSVSDCFLHLGIAASPVCIERHSYFLPKRILKHSFDFCHGLYILFDTELLLFNKRNTYYLFYSKYELIILL